MRIFRCVWALVRLVLPRDCERVAFAMNAIVSMVRYATSTLTKDTQANDLIIAIRGEKYKAKVDAVRKAFATGGKKAADPFKKKLPAVTWSGRFTKRNGESLEQYSGLLCADLDNLGETHVQPLLQDLARDPHLFTAFRSPTGSGLKAVFRVAGDADHHAGNFQAVKSHVQRQYGLSVDESGKDLARLCFVSHDPDAIYNEEAVPLEPELEAVTPKIGDQPTLTNNPGRQQIAESILGAIKWNSDTDGLCQCPGAHLHTTGNGARDCAVFINGVPTVKCFHDSCTEIIAGINHELRSRIGKAERVEIFHNEKNQEQEQPAPDALPKIDNATALVADDSLTPPAEVVKGLLHQGCKGVIGATSKARKTWLLLDLALSVQAGVPFWRWDTTKGRVLYINFEIPRAFTRQRIKRLCEAKGITDVSGLDVWTLRGHAAALWRLVPLILERIKQCDYILIVIDPVYKCLGGRDENSAGDTGELCNEMERLAVQSGAAVVFAAHFSKGNQAGKEAMDRISGSGVFGRDPDSIITLTKHEQDGAYTVDMILRNFPEQDPFVVQWEFPLMVAAGELDPAELKGRKGRKQKHTPEKVVSVLGDQRLTTTEWKDLSENEAGISKSSFYELLPEVQELKLAIQSKVDSKWSRICKR